MKHLKNSPKGLSYPLNNKMYPWNVSQNVSHLIKVYDLFN